MKNPFELTGKRILVTGASSGIGRSVAVECSKMGADLILVGRNLNTLEETKSLLTNNGQTEIYVADFSQDIDFSNLFINLNKIDGIVHCAGMIKKKPAKFIKQEDFDDSFKINYENPLLLTTYISKKGLLNNCGSIVFISSIAVDIASIGNIVYMSTKGALKSASRGYALELASKGIRVNTIEPALVNTKLADVLTEEDKSNYLKKFPLGRFGEPEEIAWASIYLLSDASKWVTGISLRMDGGVTLN